MNDALIIDDLTEDETVALNANLKKLALHADRNVLRASYYDGKRAAKQIGSVIPPQYARLGLALGWPAKAVDGLARRCQLEKMLWADGDLGSLGMAELADSNFLYSEIAQAVTDSLLHGVSYLVTTRGTEGEPTALVHARDALNATGTWNNRKRRLDDFLSVTSWTKGKPTGFVLYLDGLTINGDLRDGEWVVEKSVHPWGMPAEPLVYRPRTSKRMGRSRITRPVMAHTDSALRSLVRLEAHMDIYAIPKFILLGGSEAAFKNADGTTKTSWQVALGRVFGIPDDEDAATPRASVQQFSAESPEPHLADLNALAKLMARETDLPDADFALTDMANPTSAEAYDSGRDSLIAEAEGATQLDWSPAIRRTVTRALAIQNGLDEVPAEWASIDTKFRDPRYLSKAAQADAGAKQISMVPWLAETEVGLELLGLDEQQIQRALADRRRAAGRALVASLAPVGGAVAAPVVEARTDAVTA